MPLGGTGLRVGASLMLNVLGDPGGSMEETTKILKQALPVPGKTHKGDRERQRETEGEMSMDLGKCFVSFSPWSHPLVTLSFC